MKKIDPRSPGQSTATDDFCDPHNRVGDFAGNPHAGLSRDSDGSFNGSMSQGGTSPDGDAMVAKYRPGRSGGGSSDEIPSGSELNDTGDGYA